MRHPLPRRLQLRTKRLDIGLPIHEFPIESPPFVQCPTESSGQFTFGFGRRRATVLDVAGERRPMGVKEPAPGPAVALGARRLEVAMVVDRRIDQRCGTCRFPPNRVALRSEPVGDRRSASDGIRQEHVVDDGHRRHPFERCRQRRQISRPELSSVADGKSVTGLERCRHGVGMSHDHQGRWRNVEHLEPEGKQQAGTRVLPEPRLFSKVVVQKSGRLGPEGASNQFVLAVGLMGRRSDPCPAQFRE